jgi:hypothetical protein
VEPKHTGRSGQRSLWAAEGVLVGLCRCTLDEAFTDIVSAAKRHNVDPLALADALITIAEDDLIQNFDDDVAAAVRGAWGDLLDRRSGNADTSPHQLGIATRTENELDADYERANS